MSEYDRCFCVSDAQREKVCQGREVRSSFVLRVSTLGECRDDEILIFGGRGRVGAKHPSRWMHMLKALNSYVVEQTEAENMACANAQQITFGSGCGAQT